VRKIRRSGPAMRIAARAACASSMLVLIIPLAACGKSATPDAEGWTQPAWMSQQLQDEEVFVANVQSCMDAKGWNLTVDASGGFAEPFSDEAEMKRAADDVHSCLADQGIDVTQFEQPLTDSALRTMYRYDVDTYECLAAQGLDMQDPPPSQDAYVESALAAQDGQEADDSWWPYYDPAVTALSSSEVADLQQVCPERWTFAALS
jgi:hypothetical protein